jgi:hypothetical protein
MKVLSLIVSVVTLIATLLLMIADFPDVGTLSGVIYLLLLIILFMICITGIILNRPVMNRIHNKFRITYTNAKQ